MASVYAATKGAPVAITRNWAAAVALFLLSDDSAYVTSSQYPVDGGLTKR